MADTGRANFGSRLGVVLATAGSAVGLGNIWRFPYLAGENGGAAFILIYIACVLVLGIPCMISEFIIGRRGASNTARAYTKLANGTAWRWVGYLEVLTGYLITGYYAVVTGWCLNYIYASIVGELKGDPAYVVDYFNDFVASPIRPIFWTVAIFLVTHFIIVHGIRNGIEKASKLMMPTLFILLLVVVVCSCLLPNADKGLTFLFKPDFSKVSSNVFLSALGQAFYSLSIAMGCLCTYASYFSRQTHIGSRTRGHDDIPRGFLRGYLSRQRPLPHLHYTSQRIQSGFRLHARLGLGGRIAILCTAFPCRPHFADVVA